MTVRLTECPNVRMSECPVSACPHVRMSECPNVRMTLRTTDQEPRLKDNLGSINLASINLASRINQPGLKNQSTWPQEPQTVDQEPRLQRSVRPCRVRPRGHGAMSGEAVRPRLMKNTIEQL